MRFGDRLRELRIAKNMSQRSLAGVVGVSHTYVSKVETGHLDFGDFPSEGLIRKLAEALSADEDELLLLAEKVPERIRRRIIERPEVFRKLAALNDRELDRVLAATESTGRTRKQPR